MNRIFDNITTQSNENFSHMMLSVPEWPQKKNAFEKLDEHLKKRVRSYFHSWQKNIEAMSYL